MTAYLAPRPEDVYDAETVAGFRAAGYWRDETLSASVDRLAGQDRVVLTDGYGALTGAELREQAYRLAAALRRLGVGASRQPADAPHCVIYTSGTESRPKGCLHTLNTITFTVHALGGEVMAMGPGDVMFMPSPVTHATGLAMGVIAPLILGAGVHLMDVWSREAGLRRIAEHQCTMSMTATPFVQMTLAGCSPIPRRRPSWPRCGAGPAPERPSRRSCSAAGRSRCPAARCCRSTAGGGPAGDRVHRRFGRARAILRRPGVPRGRARDLRSGRQAGAGRHRRRDLPRRPGPDAGLLAGRGAHRGVHRRPRRIAPQKLPEMLQVVDALPTTMTGKVQKFLLRDQARALADQPSWPADPG